MKTCDHCGTPAKTRVPVMIDGSVCLVGTGCAGKFKRAKRSDLFRSLYEANYMAVSDDLIEEYPQHEDAINLFKESDPSGRMKYIKWQVKILDSGEALAPEIIDVTALFHRFNQRLDKKDIFAYPSEEFSSLRDKLFEFEEEQVLRRRRDPSATVLTRIIEKEKVPESCHVEFVFKNNEHVVVFIKNKAASVHYGVGTKWCVTHKDRSYFEDYEARNDVFFFIMSKNVDTSNPMFKIAVNYHRDDDNSVYSVEFWHAENQRVSNAEVHDFIGKDYVPMLEIMTKIAANFPRSDLSKIAGGIATEKEIVKVFKEIANWEDEDSKNSALIQIAKNKKTPTSILTLMLKKIIPLIIKGERYDSELLEKIISNQNVSAMYLEFLYILDNEKVKAILARNPKKLSREVLQSMVGSDSEIVRRSLADSDVNPKVLIKLLNDKDYEVIRTIASKYNLHPSVAIKMWKMANKFENPTRIKSALISRDAIPDNIFKKEFENCIKNEDKLTKEEMSICESLASSSKLSTMDLERMAKMNSPSIKKAILSSYNTTRKIVEELSNSEDEEIRMSAVGAPIASDEIILKLSEDPSPNVRGRVAASYRSSKDIVRKLFNDPSMEVRILAAGNSKLPSELLPEAMNLFPEGSWKREEIKNRIETESRLPSKKEISKEREDEESSIMRRIIQEFGRPEK